MKILITGSSGFIGTNLLEHFLQENMEITNFDILPPRNRSHSPFWRPVDLLNAQQLGKELRSFSPTHVFHLAARTNLGGQRMEDYAVNTIGVLNLINALKKLDTLERIIFASSMLVCKNGYPPQNESDYCPDTHYGQSKVEGECIIRRENLQATWTIVRPTSIWGPWFGLPYRGFFEMVAAGRYLHPRHSKTLKAMGFVGNTVHQLNKIITAPPEQIHGKTFYLADYEPMDILGWANQIRSANGQNPVGTAPLSLLRIGAALGDIAQFFGYPNPPLTYSRLRNLLTSNFVYDLNDLKRLAGDLPFSTKEGTLLTMDWMEKNHVVS